MGNLAYQARALPGAETLELIQEEQVQVKKLGLKGMLFRIQVLIGCTEALFLESMLKREQCGRLSPSLLAQNLKMCEAFGEQRVDLWGGDSDIRPFLARDGTERIAAKSEFVEGEVSLRHWFLLRRSCRLELI